MEVRLCWKEREALSSSETAQPAERQMLNEDQVPNEFSHLIDWTGSKPFNNLGLKN
jgi:hypothetical protein